MKIIEAASSEEPNNTSPAPFNQSLGPSKLLHTVTFLPSGEKTQVPDGTSVLLAADKVHISIGSLCGGEGICGRCTMIIREGTVTSESFNKLTRQQIQDGYVLGCLSYIKSDVVVEVPPEHLIKNALPARDDAKRFRDFQSSASPIKLRYAPLVQKVYLELEKPTLASNFADHQRLCALIRKKLDVTAIQTGLKVIKSLPALLRSCDFKVTATVGIRGKIAEVVDVEPGNTAQKNFIAVVDMGTTTIVVHLVDATKNKTIDAKACFNAQSIFGGEVTARMMAAEKIGCEELQKLLINDINRLISELAHQNEVNLKNITAVVCAGNTVMGHFLLALPIENIRRFPYIACSVEPPPLRAAEIGITINPRGLLYSLPGVSGWVGSDLTAGILATGMHESEELCLLVDIGTNGEVIVGNREWLMGCSASAGPALEGASVECGMRAESGAIEKVFLEHDTIRYKTINDSYPRGLCGSGIIDLISVLLGKGLITRAGKMVQSDPERFFSKDGIPGYVLVKEGEDGNSKPVYITETDIGNIINAKASIYAAMKIILLRLELDFSDINRFLIAGAFGNYLNIESAITIGLIPNVPRERIHFVGNTSIRGATIVALHREALDQIIGIERGTTYYDLMGADDYVEEFSKAMFLPHTDIESFTKKVLEN
jgi:uncharacterized 2Fe-2S/4Fe-4S cluster protein (DUF4445 family)